MNIVLLSGGSGKRLWPMSNDSRSKQFLKVLKDKDGNRLSMLQRVWSQLEAAGLRNHSYICAPKTQYDTIESQVGGVHFIEEPTRRDTFPAIALATTYLSDVMNLADDEVVAVIPVDPFVDLTYFQTITQMESALMDSQADIVLMGVQPTSPTSKFGYIRVRSGEPGGSRIMRVDSFVEKPNKELAASLIDEGALWNCGVFAFRIGFLRAQLERAGLPSTFRDLVDMYALLPKRSFDYEIVEKTSDIVVVPYDGAWEDLGTWGSLSQKMENQFIGIGSSFACDNTHVINELGLPIVAMGLKDVMVVATPDGMLVADKETAADVKSVIEPYSSYPMYEERRWGTYRALDYQKLSDGTEVLTRCITLNTGKNLSYQKHRKRTEVWTIVQGYGEALLGTTVYPVTNGAVIRIEPGEWHALRALDSLLLIEVQHGTELVEGDIVRSELSWNEIVNQPIMTVG